MNNIRTMKNVFDRRLSGIKVEPRHLYTIMREAKGELIVKKKLSLILVSVLLSVILLGGIAYALIPWQQVGQEVAVMEAENGYFDSWSVDNKTELIKMLLEVGEIQLNENIQALMEGTLNDTEANAIATEAIETWTRLPEGAVTLISILERMLGKFSTWSIEDKAWYSEILMETGRLGSDEITYLKPGDHDLPQERALEIAKEGIINAYGLNQEQVDEYATDYEFYTMRGGVDESHWLLSFKPLMDYGYAEHYDFYVCINNQGVIVEDGQRGIPLPGVSENVTTNTGSIDVGSDTDGYLSMEELYAIKGETIYWTLEEKAHYITWYGLPGENDISEEEALSIAEMTINQSHTEAELRDYIPYTAFIVDSTEIKTPYWQIDYIHHDKSGRSIDIITVYIDAETGDVIHSTDDYNG